MTEREFVAAVNSAGGNVYVVGGFVRDMLRGVPPKDKDYCVTALEEDLFCSLFDKAERVGKSFPVYLLDIDGVSCEVAFARTERKTGTGYRGFSVRCDPSVGILDDLSRRDTTMNAIALSLPTGKIIDPFFGARDIANKKIRAVGKTFADDPVRALRAARQAAEFGFDIDSRVYDYMALCAKEIGGEATERVCGEMIRALNTAAPSRFFCALKRGHILKETFPELFDLISKTQPEAFHPEGDAFNHTMIVTDKAAALTGMTEARFAALAHDIGKGRTKDDMLPHHYGHENAGLCVLADWNRRMTLPKNFYKAAQLVIAEHMRAPTMKRPGKRAELLMKIHASSLSLQGFNACIAADCGYLPDYLAHGDELLPELLAVKGGDAPAGLSGEQIGKWIKERRAKAFLCTYNRLKERSS